MSKHDPEPVNVSALIRDVCETEPADPDKPDTICIDVALLTQIIERHTGAPCNKKAHKHDWVIGYGFPAFCDRCRAPMLGPGSCSPCGGAQ